MIKILLSGICGHMGAEIIKLVNDSEDLEIIAGVDNSKNDNVSVPVFSAFDEIDNAGDIDCVVDFSNNVLTKDLTTWAVKNKKPLVIATTGQTDEEKQMIKDAAKDIPVFYAANFSLGIALLIELAKKAAKAMPEAEIEIVETHHDRKVDAPSGTAIAIAEGIKTVRSDMFIHEGRSGYGKREKNEIGISSVRMGNIAGIHEVIVGTQSQTITLKHEAQSRALFAEGAVAAVKYIAGKPAGLYDMNSMIGD